MARSVRQVLLICLLHAIACTYVTVFAYPATAAEVISSFNSAVKLSVNGTVEVVETITVESESNRIRHGIFRDIPTQLINDDNSRLRSTLNVLEVNRDGRDEPYTEESLGTGFKRIRIGSADVFLDPGQHTYTIRYTMSRMARSFPDHDEIFWNATGNYWEFPILKSSAIITLPDGATVEGAVGYTGVPGSTEQAVTITSRGPGQTLFVADRTLAAGEGMSVAVKFQKGILTAPGGLTLVSNWLSDHRELVFPLIGALIVFMYNYFAWSAVGRDPRRGTIIPLFYPPERMSAPMVHYIHTMGFKQNGWTALTSAIFDLGVKGLVMIDKVGKSTRITSLGEAPAGTVPPEEQALYSFVRARGVVEIDKTDGPELNKRRNELVTTITKDKGDVYFRNNVLYTVAGFVLTLAMLGALMLLDIIDPSVLIIATFVSVVIGVVIGVISGMLGGGSNWFNHIFTAVWVAIILGNVVGSVGGFLSNIHLDTGIIGAASLVLIQVIFAFIMRAPTVEGRRLMDQIAGFRMYLDTAEKNRLNYVARGEPEMTVKRFEAILPFAIALGVEKPWSQRFESDLARNAVSDAADGYSPRWYRGSNWSSSSSGFSSAVSSIATGMSASMIAAQPSSSSGSGFSSGGGGGSSGGGGGGGGGGGW